MLLTIDLSPGIVYAMLSCAVVVTALVVCYMDARNRIKERD